MQISEPLHKSDDTPRTNISSMPLFDFSLGISFESMLCFHKSCKVRFASIIHLISPEGR